MARNKIVFSAIMKFCNLLPGDNILDAGCGTGGFAAKMSEKFNVLCLDISPIALDYCRKRGLTNLFNTDLEGFPKEKWHLGAVTMLDVVEHIEDDRGAVSQVFKLLPEGGYFIATVPAYKWLWSRHDELHLHKRRYTRRNFSRLIQDAGFKIEYTTYFNMFLLLPAAIKRLLKKFLRLEESGDETTIDEFGRTANSI